VTKRKGSAEEGRVFTCSNPVCGRTFFVPMKLVDLRVNDPEPCLACPHCLGQIASDLGPRFDDSATNVTVENVESKPEQPRELERHVEGPIAKCAHHLGFLSERSSKEEISEECMVCEKIVRCMLKSVRD
jgi:hypothetical protein